MRRSNRHLGRPEGEEDRRKRQDRSSDSDKRVCRPEVRLPTNPDATPVLSRMPVPLSAAFGESTLPMLSPTVPGKGRSKGSMVQPRRTIEPCNDVDSSDYFDLGEKLLAKKPSLGRSKNPSTDRSGPRARKVDLPKYANSSKVPKKIEDSVPKAQMKGSNQSGRHLECDHGTLPDGANYEGQYASRTLTYFSDIARSALEMRGVPPTEVQFGHTFNDEQDTGLSVSTNNLASQAVLHDLLKDPEDMVKSVLGSNVESYEDGLKHPSSDSRRSRSKDEVAQSKKHAMKLLLWDQLDERRSTAIDRSLSSGDISEKDAKQRHADLELANLEFDAFSTGNVEVVLSPSVKTESKMSETELLEKGRTRAAKAEARRTKQAKSYNKQVETYEKNLTSWESKDEKTRGNKPKAPKRPSAPTSSMLGSARHAEQNVAKGMTDTNDERVERKEAPVTHSDIQGTMIRCTACANEVGLNTEKDGKPIMGRVFGSQTSPNLFVEDAKNKMDGKQEAISGTQSVYMPGSPGSPAPTFD